MKTKISRVASAHAHVQRLAREAQTPYTPADVAAGGYVDQDSGRTIKFDGFQQANAQFRVEYYEALQEAEASLRHALQLVAQLEYGDTRVRR